MNKIMKFVCMFLLLFAFGIKPIEPQAASNQATVILDPGHGGKYGGTTGFSGNRTGYYEKHANLEVSNRIKSELEKLGFKVIMTRTTDKHFSSSSQNVDLRERMTYANSLAAGNYDNSVFVSVHHNATSSPTYGGYETYYYNKNSQDSRYPADPMQNYYSPESQRLAETTHGKVIGSGIKEGRGIIYNSLYVTRAAKMPSLLMEVGYMSKPAEEAMIKQPWFQQKGAANFAKGVDAFFSVYLVKDAKGNVIKQFSSKTDALNYAKRVSSSTVTFKKTGAVIGEDAPSKPAPTPTPTPTPVVGPLVYGVFHSSVAMKNNYFSSEQAAVSFASKYRNTRVVNSTSKSIVWSNYLPQRYHVTDKSGNVTKKFYQEQEAMDYAGKLSTASVVDDVTKNMLWSNFKDKNFVVRSNDKGKMISMYNREEARNYTRLWYNTELYDVWADKVIEKSSANSSYSYKPVNVYAKDRLRTAIEVSKQLYPKGFSSTKSKKTVVIATSHEYADALSAGPLASYYDNAPILLNKQASLSSDVEAELKRLKANHVILVGGTVALSTSVENKLKGMKLTVERLSGASRYETNEKINTKLPDSDGVLVASGSNYPDALTAASVAVVKQWPIVLVNERVEIPNRLKNAHGDNIFIVGGTLAVPESIEKQISKDLGADLVQRLSGKSRYETSIEVINKFKDDFISPKLVVSVGSNYPDALVSSALSARYDAPLFLVPESGLPESVEDSISQHSTEKLISETYYIGGTISSSVKSQINGLQK